MRTQAALTLVALLGLPLVACGLSEKAPEIDMQSQETQADSHPSEAGSDEAGEDAGAGLPCDVAALLKANCTSCHSATHPGVPMALVTRDDLIAPATTDPTKKVYELARDRMSDSAKPMPPGGLLDANVVAAFNTWANAGAPATVCGAAEADASVAPHVDAGLPECVLNSDCPGELICRSGSCDVECITDKDCTVTWTCEETRCHPPVASTTTPDAGADDGSSDAGE